MSLAHCFPPLADAQARVLILGSMPGQASLRAAHYYAHPHNAFWPIMGELLGFAPQLPYEARCARLQAGGVALWDVLARCERPGSLDADIRAGEPNDLAALLEGLPALRAVACNGGKAAALAARHFGPLLAARGLPCLSLPSSSPAHARLTRADKQALWHAALAPWLG